MLEFYYAHKDDDAKTLAHAVLSNESFWGEDLTAVPGFEAARRGRPRGHRRPRARYEMMKQTL